MMRLIDADVLIELIDKEYPTVDRQDMKMMVAKAPTAYDVDEVIEELNYIEMKWDKVCPMPNEYGEPMCDLDCVECQIRRCRRTVERGGIYE